MSHLTPNPALDLVLERTIPVPPERVWAAWTQPELLMQWFTPAPWKTVSADLDVRPGGRCVTTMESPEGDQYPNAGCYLHVEPNRHPTAVPITARSRCTPTRTRASSTPKWASPTAGELPSTNWSR